LRAQLQGPLVPIQKAFAITKSDTDDLAYETRALWVGSTGNIVATFADGTQVTIMSVPVGMYSWALTKIDSTNTTAGSFVGFY